MAPQLSSPHKRSKPTSCRKDARGIARILKEKLGVRQLDIDSFVKEGFRIQLEKMDDGMDVEELHCQYSKISAHLKSKVTGTYLLFFALVILGSGQKDTAVLQLIRWHLQRHLNDTTKTSISERESNGKRKDSTYKNMNDDVLKKLTSVYVELKGMSVDDKTKDIPYYALAFIFLFLKGKPLQTINEVSTMYKEFNSRNDVDLKFASSGDAVKHFVKHFVYDLDIVCSEHTIKYYFKTLVSELLKRGTRKTETSRDISTYTLHLALPGHFVADSSTNDDRITNTWFMKLTNENHKILTLHIVDNKNN